MTKPDVSSSRQMTQSGNRSESFCFLISPASPAAARTHVARAETELNYLNPFDVFERFECFARSIFLPQHLGLRKVIHEARARSYWAFPMTDSILLLLVLEGRVATSFTSPINNGRISRGCRLSPVQ